MSGKSLQKSSKKTRSEGCPLLSVVVPIYNVEPYLRRCMDSICGQDYPNMEIICVDDGSKDQSLAIVREYESKDERVRVVVKPNGGLASARNAGLDVARGVWLAGVDPDDYLLPGAYSTAMSHATDDVDLVVFGAVVEAEDGAGQDVRSDRMQRYLTIPEGLYELNAEGISKHNVVFWNKLYRRSILEENNLRFDNELRRSEDICFHLRFCAYGRRAYFCPTPFYAYILRCGSISSSSKNAERDLVDLLRSLDNVAAVYAKLDLVEEYGGVLNSLVYSTRNYVDPRSMLVCAPLMWRERMLRHIKKNGLQRCSVVAPIVQEMDEQLRTAQRAVALLECCASRTVASAPCGGEEIHVAIPTDETYAGPAAMLALSLKLSAVDGRRVCVHFICDDVSICTREQLQKLAEGDFHVCLHEVPAELLLHLPSLENSFPHAGYLKMALPWLLPEVERVLVIPPGMMVKGELPALNSVEMEEMPVAVLRDYPMGDREASARRLQLEGYEACAVLMMDLAMIRSQGGAEPWVSACMFTHRRYKRAEVDSFNIAFTGRMAYLPDAWLKMIGPATTLELKKAATEQGALLAGLPVDVPRRNAWIPQAAPADGGTSAPAAESAVAENDVTGIAVQYRQLRRRYRYYGLMSKLTWGRRRQHYEEQRRSHQAALREIRRYFRDCRKEWGV